MMSRKSAFSLIEMVVVTVIIAIIAAIAVPRMSRAAQGSGDAALSANLATIRSAIELYTMDHNGNLPGINLLGCLTLYSNEAGGFSSNKSVTYYMGPYIKGPTLPPLPVGSKKGGTNYKYVTDATAVPPSGSTLQGWWWNTATGEFRANLADTETDAAGKPYNQY